MSDISNYDEETSEVNVQQLSPKDSDMDILKNVRKCQMVEESYDKEKKNKQWSA